MIHSSPAATIRKPPDTANTYSGSRTAMDRR